MAVVFTLLTPGNSDTRVQYQMTMVAADPQVLHNVFADLGAGQAKLRKVLGEAVASDAAARVLLGLRAAADSALGDQRMRVTYVTQTAGLMPAITALRDAGTGLAFLAVTAAGAGASTEGILTLEIIEENQKADGSSV